MNVSHLQVMKKILLYSSSWRKQITAVLEEKAGVPEDIVSGISVVSTGYRDISPVGCDDWYTPFWTSIFKKTRHNGQSALLRLTYGRLVDNGNPDISELECSSDNPYALPVKYTEPDISSLESDTSDHPQRFDNGTLPFPSVADTASVVQPDPPSPGAPNLSHFSNGTRDLPSDSTALQIDPVVDPLAADNPPPESPPSPGASNGTTDLPVPPDSTTLQTDLPVTNPSPLHNGAAIPPDNPPGDPPENPPIDPPAEPPTDPPADQATSSTIKPAMGGIASMAATGAIIGALVGIAGFPFGMAIGAAGGLVAGASIGVIALITHRLANYIMKKKKEERRENN